MSEKQKWFNVILFIVLIDFGIRLATSFNTPTVIRSEAVLFLSGSIVLYIMHRKTPILSEKRRVIQIIIVASFALAGIRAAIWTSGFPVYHANFTILILGFLFALALIHRRCSTKKISAEDRS